MFGNRFPGSLEQYLRYGRIMDTTRMKEAFGWKPQLTARQAVLTAYGRVAAPGVTR